MKQLDQQVARQLTRFYIIALTVIAVLAISGLLFIKKTISTHYADSRVVNVAGRQRMLSQRLTKLALLQITGMPTADTARFEALLNTWNGNHLQLRNGMLQMEKAYKVRKSPRLAGMFSRIEPVFGFIYQSFLRINNPRSTAGEKQEALQVVLREEPRFLRQMDEIVFQFDKESFERVESLERTEWVLTVATLFTLLIEALAIFRPVVLHTRNVIRKLTESEDALQSTNERLEGANQQLSITNQTLVTTQQELLRANEEKHQLQRAEDRVRSAALLEGQEEERRRFARELHDGIGQMLTGLKLNAASLKRGTFPDEKQKKRVEELGELIQDIIQTTRQISHNLMPSVLNDFGLRATLQLLADQTAQSSAIAVTFEGTGDGPKLAPAVEIGLYRIAQEALNNAVKYARAQNIRLNLQYDRHKLVLTVEDDGRGFTPGTLPKEARSLGTNGLENMRTRARLLNGELSITSKPQKGTRVAVKLTLSDTQPN